MLPKVKDKFKGSLSKSRKKTGGALSNAFNTLSGRRGLASAAGGYGVIIAGVGVGAASAALAIGTAGIAFPAVVIGANLMTGALNAHLSRLNAKPVKKRVKKAPKL